MDDPRAALDKLIRDRDEDYASLSRFIGRNGAYIQQFIRRGTPRKLDEADRRKLARYFGVDEGVLGGPAPASPTASHGARLTIVPRYATAASAGPGAVPDDEGTTGEFAFTTRYLRDDLQANPGEVTAIKVAGDSMAPTLNDGDDIMVDLSDGAERLRDGIYVLRFDDALNVKRIARNPVDRRLTVKSDNPAWPSFADVDPARIDIIGRVIWSARRVR